jgi:predicted protein tyrosine phosphatase
MTIIVCPLSRVHEMIGQHKPARVVSLLDPEMAFPETGPTYLDKHLRVKMHDITELEAMSVAPDENHVTALLDFIGAWEEQGPLLVHCYAGISRSTATAFISACMHNPDSDEVVIAQALRAASATATPNRRLVQLADKALGRKGQMLYAVETIGHGAPAWHEIGEARPFAIPSYFSPR